MRKKSISYIIMHRFMENIRFICNMNRKIIVDFAFEDATFQRDTIHLIDFICMNYFRAENLV